MLLRFLLVDWTSIIQRYILKASTVKSEEMNMVVRRSHIKNLFWRINPHINAIICDSITTRHKEIDVTQNAMKLKYSGARFSLSENVEVPCVGSLDTGGALSSGAALASPCKAPPGGVINIAKVKAATTGAATLMIPSTCVVQMTFFSLPLRVTNLFLLLQLDSKSIGSESYSKYVDSIVASNFLMIF